MEEDLEESYKKKKETVLIKALWQVRGRERKIRATW